MDRSTSGRLPRVRRRDIRFVLRGKGIGPGAAVVGRCRRWREKAWSWRARRGRSGIVDRRRTGPVDAVQRRGRARGRRRRRARRRPGAGVVPRVAAPRVLALRVAAQCVAARRRWVGCRRAWFVQRRPDPERLPRARPLPLGRWLQRARRGHRGRAGQHAAQVPGHAESWSSRRAMNARRRRRGSAMISPRPQP